MAKMSVFEVSMTGVYGRKVEGSSGGARRTQEAIGEGASRVSL